MPLTDCKFIWKNGKLLPWEKATVHVSCHGLHYGTGVFEGIRCYKTPAGPAVFRLAEHLDRWFASATVYGMLLPFSRDKLAQAVLSVIEANEFEDCYIRPIAFFGSETLSLHPRKSPVEVAIFAWPWDAYLGSSGLETGIHAAISRWSKFRSESIPAVAKACGQYLNSVLAVQDAVARGFDEAILLDDRGLVTEGSGENIFLIKDGSLITNDQQSSVLMGITRDTVLQLARDLGIHTLIRPITLQDFREADEAFFTGTAVEVAPIASIDHHPVGKGGKGPTTAILQRVFFDITSGKNQRYHSWLTPVTTSQKPTQATLPGIAR